jgi:hypothetical protein
MIMSAFLPPFYQKQGRQVNEGRIGLDRPGHNLHSDGQPMLKTGLVSRPFRGTRAVGAVLLLALSLILAGPVRPAAAGQRNPIVSGVDRVVAVGDLHGAYDNFVLLLRATGIVGPDLHWTGGRNHLVQIGDVIDRGPGARKIFDLIRRLEGEAAEAGGRVHMLIGNHEAIAIMGLSFDYEGAVSVEQFLSFLPERYRRAKEEEFRKKDGPEADLTSLWAQLSRTDLGAQSAYFEFFREHYGRWIADHDTAVKIDGAVFVHGGINEEYSRWSLERLNRIVSMELLGLMMNRPMQPKVVFDPRGPLWYRDDAGPEDVMTGEIDRVLANLGAKALVIGHTSTIGSRTLALSRLDGRVWTIDTGIWEPFSGRLGALIYEGGQFRVQGVEDERHDRDRRAPASGAAAALR